MAIDIKFCGECGNQLDINDRFCSKCKNIINNGVKFCGECGNKVDITNKFCRNCGNVLYEQNISKKKLLNKLLNNVLVFIMFIVNTLLFWFIGMYISFDKMDMGPAGIMFVFVPFVAVFFIIPQIVGLILSFINMFSKNLSIIKSLVIINCISIITTIIYILTYLRIEVVYIALFQSVFLLLMCLLKMIYKIRD